MQKILDNVGLLCNFLRQDGTNCLTVQEEIKTRPATSGVSEITTPTDFERDGRFNNVLSNHACVIRTAGYSINITTFPFQIIRKWFYALMPPRNGKGIRPNLQKKTYRNVFLSQSPEQNFNLRWQAYKCSSRDNIFLKVKYPIDCAITETTSCSMWAE